MIYDSKQAKKTMKKGSMSDICVDSCLLKAFQSIVLNLDKRVTRILDDVAVAGAGQKR